MQLLNESIAWEMKKYPLIADNSGELGVLEYGKEFGFVGKRFFFLRGVKSGVIRGQQAHKNLKQLIVCLSGSFTIDLDSGLKKETFTMTSDCECLYLDGLVWREMRDFSTDAVMLVICDRKYENDEVIRDYIDFKKITDGVKVERI